MKHIKLFENKTAFDSMLKLVTKYNKLCGELMPYVLYKYNELARDNEYFPDWDSTPSIEYENLEDLTIVDIGELNDGGLGFTVVDYDSEGVINEKYYVWLDPGEVEDIDMKITSGKYNI